jgi:hypothetical protein
VSSLTETFAGADVSKYPDVHSYSDDLDALLWVLMVAAKSGSNDWLTASHVCGILRDVYGRDVTRQRAANLLGGAKGLVAAKRPDREAVFRIMKKGEERVLAAGGSVLVVEPDKAFTALQRLDTILGSLEGEVLLCDPYVDDKTLVHLTMVPKVSRIRVLTVNVSDPPRFRTKLQAYEREYGNVEIRTDAAATLHDRYLIDDRTMWSLGQSLNGVGKKQTLIVRQGEDLRAAMRGVFKARWNGARAWT